LRFAIATIILVLTIIGLKELAVSKDWIQSPSMFYITLGFVVFSTVLIHSYLVKIQKDHFIQFYLLLTVVKLIAFLAYNVVILIKDNSQAFVNVTVFLICYLAFTALEIVFLYRHINSRKAP
jgi:hypothetical protein